MQSSCCRRACRRTCALRKAVRSSCSTCPCSSDVIAGPTASSLGPMPQRKSMSRIKDVAAAKSDAAPEDGEPKTMISAARPAMSVVSMSRDAFGVSTLFVRRRVCPAPSSPRERRTTNSTGIPIARATTAWPLSWTATRRSSSAHRGDMTSVISPLRSASSTSRRARLARARARLTQAAQSAPVASTISRAIPRRSASGNAVPR